MTPSTPTPAERTKLLRLSGSVSVEKDGVAKVRAHREEIEVTSITEKNICTRNVWDKRVAIGELDKPQSDFMQSSHDVRYYVYCWPENLEPARVALVSAIQSEVEKQYRQAVALKTAWDERKKSQ